MPAHGPVILVGNHANQFVDAMNLIGATKRPISFLIAKKSYDRRYIGDVAKAIGAVPVIRPQDVAFAGTGKILSVTVDEEAGTAKVIGDGGCKFTQVALKRGAKLRGGAWDGELYVKADPISDNELVLAKPPEVRRRAKRRGGGARGAKLVPNTLPAQPITIPEGGCTYKILPKVDQKKVFESVLTVLSKNGVIGIFPEGEGSERKRRGG